MAQQAEINGETVSRSDLAAIGRAVEADPERYRSDPAIREAMVSMVVSLALGETDQNGKPIGNRLRLAAVKLYQRFDELNLKFNPPVQKRLNVTASTGDVARREALREFLAAEVSRRGITVEATATEVQRELEAKREMELERRLAELEKRDPILAAPESVDVGAVELEDCGESLAAIPEAPAESAGAEIVGACFELPEGLAELYRADQ